MSCEALGLELRGELPEGSMVVDVLVVAKILDAEGRVCLVQMSTPELRTWEAAGMALTLTDRLRSAMQASFEADDDD